ncbi:MAG: exo-alpha-sialidase [Chthonomonas sp.]|nr:exo-alpha-sialidase [Chthonomonas sp.]
MAEPAIQLTWQPSTASNRSYREGTHARLPLVRTTLYRPHQTWTYNNHPFITEWEGTFVAMWSNGQRDEDEVGQRVLVATSGNGTEWTEPRVLAEPFGKRVLTAGGFFVSPHGLVALYSDYNEDVADTKLYAKVTKDGLHWSRPLPLGPKLCSNQNALRLASGRLILAGNFAMPFTDDPTGLAGWRWSSIAPSFAEEDNPWTFWQVRRQSQSAADLCEASVVELADGQLVSYFRATGQDYNGFLWQSVSTDRGTSWSRPHASDFTDNDAKFQFGRLDESRWFYCGCPDLNVGKRNPLVFSTSRDGFRFDRHWVVSDEPHRINWPGKHKSGDYSYPNVLIRDGRAYVIVARQKEDIEVLSFALSDLR